VQIDAPERARNECFGAAAARELRRLLPPGTEVRVAYDERLDRVDRFGRTLGYVFVGDLNVNGTLVEVGAAAPYFFGGGRGRYADELLDAAERARRERRGLWGACPVAALDPSRSVQTGPMTSW
jgi:micrococcal nuclease